MHRVPSPSSANVYHGRHARLVLELQIEFLVEGEDGVFRGVEVACAAATGGVELARVWGGSGSGRGRGRGRGGLGVEVKVVERGDVASAAAGGVDAGGGMG